MVRKKIFQFAYKRPRVETEMWAAGLEESSPRIDCRVIPNPFSKAKTDRERKLLVKRDPQFETLVQAGLDGLGCSDVIAVGCEYGKHRSGSVVEEIEKRFDGDVIVFRLPYGG